MAVTLTDKKRNSVGKGRLAKVTKGLCYAIATSEEGDTVKEWSDKDEKAMEMVAYGLLLVWDGLNQQVQSG